MNDHELPLLQHRASEDDMSDDTITVKSEAGAVHIDRPHIATLPTGERVELPAGTVLREGTLPPDAEDDRPTLGEQIHEEHERTR